MTPACYSYSPGENDVKSNKKCTILVTVKCPAFVPSVTKAGERAAWFLEILHWVNQNIEPDMVDAEDFDYINDQKKFWFAREEDAALFALRWA